MEPHLTILYPNNRSISPGTETDGVTSLVLKIRLTRVVCISDGPSCQI